MNNLDIAFEIKRRKIVGRIGIIFLCVMVVLTFFSKSINNLTLPRVKTEQAASGSLVKEITEDGVVLAKESQYEYSFLNTTIEEIKVKVGDAVKKGQVIARLRSQDAKRELEEEKIRLEKLKLSLQKLIDEAPDTSGRETDRKVDSAAQVLEEAEKDYKNTRLMYEAGSESLSSMQTAESKLKEARRNYEQALDDYENSTKSSQRDIKNTRYDIQLQQLKIDKLEQQLANDYIIKAKQDGTVKELNFEAGAIVNSSKPICVISDTQKGFEFRTLIDADSAEYLAVGDEAQISIKSISGKSIKGKITKLIDAEQQNEGKKYVYLDIEDTALSGQETGEIYISKDLGFYDMITDSSAISADSEGRFLWVSRERKGLLGNEIYAAKAYVTVGESDNYKTAILSGLDRSAEIIVSVEDNEALTDGGKVLVQE